MDTIILGKSAECCSEGVRGFAIFGIIVLAILVYIAMFFIVRELVLIVKGKRYSELSWKSKENVNLYAGCWIATVPLTLIIGALYWVVKLIALPFVAAEKRDLREMETRLDKKIIINTPISKRPKTKFAVGNLITGIKGNPDNYEHLDEGCVCKVLTIDEQGKMTVVLVDHKNFVNKK